MTASAPIAGVDSSASRGSQGTEDNADKEDRRSPRSLRFVSLNLWGENGPHEKRLNLVASELRALAPDVVAFQEVRDVPGRLPNQAETIAHALGFEVAFGPATEWGGGWEGVAIVSRYPVRNRSLRALPHSTASEGRVVLSAEIAGPAGPLWVHTTHLSYRPDEGKRREDQVVFIDGEVVAARAVPDVAVKEQPQVVLGDFNSVPEADEIRWLVGLTTLAGRRVFYQDSWASTHPGGEAGHTWLRSNPYRAQMGWLRADRRLDYIFVTPARRDGRGRVHDARVILAGPDPDGVYASDHAGVLADVQIEADAVADSVADSVAVGKDE